MNNNVNYTAAINEIVCVPAKYGAAYWNAKQILDHVLYDLDDPKVQSPTL